VRGAAAVVERGRHELTDQIADASAPFWGHVRDAVFAYREEER
jgi:hypothetical protein